MSGRVSSQTGPQWSPSGEDGTTIDRSAVIRRLLTAAMEPVRRGRDDQTGKKYPQASHPAAMEPVRRGRDDIRAAIPKVAKAAPQWSPSGEDGTTVA